MEKTVGSTEELNGHYIKIDRHLSSDEDKGEVVIIKIVTPFSERKTCTDLPENCGRCPVGYMDKVESDPEECPEGKGYCGRNIPWPPYDRPETCKLQQFSVGKLLQQYFGLDSGIAFKDRKEQRRVVEIMNSLLVDLRKHTDKKTTQAIDTTLYILSHIPVEGGDDQ